MVVVVGHNELVNEWRRLVLLGCREFAVVML
jgi:hypothetical protein